MLEVVAVFARWIQLAANLILLGGCVFLAITSSTQSILIRPWIHRVERMFPWLAVSVLIGLLLIIVTMAGQITGDIANAMKPDILIGLVTKTQVGQIWVGRVLLVCLLIAVIFYLKYATRARWHYIFCGTIATLPLVAGSLASHSAAEELSITAILPYAMHIIFAGVWFGALPALLILLLTYLKNENNQKANDCDIHTLARFSRIALPVMFLIVATGVLVSDRLFDDKYAALIATPYGWLLIAKLFLLSIILVIASRIRSNWLPKFIQNENVKESVTSASQMKKWVRIEFVFALGLVLLATVLSNTTPAKHMPIDDWPFSFRLSFEATWGITSVMVQFWIGVTLFVAACGMIQLGLIRRWNLKRIILIPLTLTVASFAVALPPIAIEAYPETYQQPPVPFDAISITNGETLYSENCVTCHGPQGKGNGILSRTLTTVLPDMLMEAHVEAHTAGDLYHWISFGMKDTDMPGYADKLDEDDRWDLINFFHALYRGYQARLLSPEIISNKPMIVPPSFYYETEDGSGGILQDFREQNTVLLIFFSWPESKNRLEQLNQMIDKFENQDTAILGVPMGDLDMETIKQIDNKLSFPIVSQGTSEIINSYTLYRRTLSHPDIIGAGKTPEHMEFLIDRYGYLRARWIPLADETGWIDTEILSKQINLLNQENMILPLPNDYVF